MEHTVKISVLIANYNNGHFFEEAYHSLVNQTFTQWEAVVIDDASTDNSAKIIQNLIRGDKRFRFYQNKKNKGYQRTVTRAIMLSQAEIFGRLDPDDVLYPKALELSLKEHENHPEVGLVYSDVSICDENLRILYHHESFQIESLNEKYYLLAGEIGAFATFKKEIYHRAGGIDPCIKRAEDIDLYIRMCETAPVKRIPEPLYYYRILKNSLSKGENGERSYFWHFVSLINMAERRNLNIEDLFVEHFIEREEIIPYRIRRNNLIKLVKNSRMLTKIWLKTGREL
ncbi:hypothetical protein OA84_04640 [Kaistella solincola]|uniref:Glycosyltransferase 2-like domain-containing protein n=1 Tax=Kaistella solincola TaxID=510955 RepID=A0ABR4ZPC9_9FLAO|nr:glycosyltransferase [Kaistella solincola]KIA82867.1 hypothetical protein OA84_04640 [Kaistella solincola]